MSQLAPIALFVYRRTSQLESVLDGLQACPEFGASDVFVFSDGPKDGSDALGVEAVRTLVRSRRMPNVRLIEAGENKGLAHSIIDGTTRLCNEYGRVIVIEDDLVVSSNLLAWFNAALDKYAADQRVMHISGYMYDAPELRDSARGLFLPIISSWGWATWKRAWDRFDASAAGWERVLTEAKLRKRFDAGDVYPYSRMLKRQMRGQIDSWAIRWYWSVFINDGISLFPSCSLVLHEGMDAYATHPSLKRRLLNAIARKPILCTQMPVLPVKIEMEEADMRAVKRAIARSRMHVPPSLETIFVR